MNCQLFARRAVTRRILCFLAFSGLSIFLMAASAPQCARTEDSPLAPVGSFAPAGVDENNPCLDACLQAAATARGIELERFTQAIRDC